MNHWKAVSALGAVLFGLVPIQKGFALEISPLIGVSSSSFSANPDLSGASAGLGFQVGGLVGWDLAPFVTGEAGALFFTQPYQIASGTDYFSTGLRIPALVRFNPLPFVSGGLGGYLGINTSVSVSGSGSTAVGNGSQALDYGFVGTIGGRFPLGAFSRLRLDLLYFFGLPNLSGGTTTLSTRTLSILVGVIFDLE